MTRALVFGASGFLGRHVAAALEQDPGVDEVLSPGRRTCDVVGADVEELTCLLDRLSPDIVVNCTGRLDGTTEELVVANTLVTAKLLDALSAVPARFVRIGSAGEYGPVREGMAAHEEAPAAPVGDYGVSHLSATGLVDSAARSGRVDGVTLRVFNPIGPGIGQQTVLGRAATQVREAVRARGASVRMGPLSAFRDFVDARDVGAAVVAAALGPRSHATINVGSGRAVRVRDAVRIIAGEAGFAGEVEEDQPAAPRSAGVDWMMADIRRARDDLGWLPAYRLEDSLAAVWRDVAPDIRTAR
jgi:nucleoside-diphosphate-sugar epimerase